MDTFRSNMHVLIVEDNAGDAHLITDYLKDEFEECTITLAKTMRNALEVIGTDKTIQAILLDLKLADGEGKELVKTVAQHTGGIPIIVLTGFSDKRFGLEAISYGAADYLLKDDLTPSLLYKTIVYALGRNQARVELKQSELKYRSLFELSPIPMWVYNIFTFQFLDVNNAATAQYGFAKEEFLNMTLFDIRPKAARRNFDSITSKIAESAEQISFYRQRKKSGDEIIVRVSGNPIEFLGEAARLEVGYDVTVQLENEAIIGRENKRLENAETIAKMGYWETDLTTNETFFSAEFLNIAAISPKNGQVKSFSSFIKLIIPSDRKRFMDAYNASYRDLSRLETEFRIKGAEANIRTIYFKSEFIISGSGKPYRYEGIIQDVTQLNAEKDQIRLQESIIANSSDAVIITDAFPISDTGPRIVFVNDAMLKLSGYTREELMGRTPRIFQGPLTNKVELAKMRKALENQEPCEIEIINYSKSGSTYWINISVSPVKDKNGVVKHYISLQRDVTERRNYTERLQKQNRTLRDIAWTQSHVVRSPLSRLMGLVNMIDEKTEPDQLSNLLGHIKSSSTELDHIIKAIVEKAEQIDQATEGVDSTDGNK